MVKHEADLSRVRPIVYVMLFTLALVVLGGLAMWPLYRYWLPRPPAPVFEPLPVPPGQVRLQRNPLADLAGYQEREQQRLHSVGWVDREAGVVHMPIERAMDLLLERGLPDAEASQ
ncbi:MULTISPECIES: hypothetical protein [unclassified Microbulbifer]|uniref:hypothetical protein n=1 Tax=unclassified Microbulbifer TaxID=2619833 RepID=UPI0027E514F2|nr:MULTISPECIES: hypothetical protein [unclassified Microbulbifer]